MFFFLQGAQLKAKRSTLTTNSTTPVDATSTESPPETATSSGSASSLVDDFTVESLFPALDVDDAYPLAAIMEADVDEEIFTTTSPTDVLATSSRYSVPRLKTPPPNLDSKYILLASTDIIAAYTSNATLLHISCTTTQPRTFDVSHSPAPTSLVPTLLQKTVPHPPFIDIIPFPGVRNRLIRSLEVIDQAKLSRDLVDGAFRVWGHVSWDGTGWEVSEAFVRKWWFLVDEQLLNITNFWRRQRLEGALLITNGEVSVED